MAMTDPSRSIADLLEDLLPQTQCTKCGYPSCRLYAEAIADDLRERRLVALPVAMRPDHD